MPDVQNIRIKYVIDTSDLEKSDRALNNLNKEEKELIENFRKVDAEAKKTNDTIQNGADKSGKSIRKAKDETDVFDKGLKKVGQTIVAAFAISSVINFTKEVIAVTGEFQKLEAVLTNTLGSKSMAQRALAEIKEFASVTPFSVGELTTAFVKLANQGFTPTTVELRKLGDLASSTGKSFDQLTEAIIDAQTGEFERLKEFGIRASKEGDKVSFTFKGVKTQTDFTNDSIRAYILSLGDLEGVSGAMAAISETLEGKVSNLGDSYESLLNTIGSGNSGVLSTAISLLSDLIKGVETALLTTDQIAQKGLDFAAKVRGEKILEYINADMKTLTDTQTMYNGVLVTTNDLLNLNVADLERDKLANQAAANVLEAQIDILNRKGVLTRAESKQRDEQRKELLELNYAIAGQQYAIDSLNTTLENNAKAEASASEAAKKAAAERKKAAEDALKNALSGLNAEEQLAIRRAKLNDATDQDINRISQYYNDQRIGLYRKYGAAAGSVFEGVKLRGEELEKELTKILADEVQKRIAEEQKFEAEYNKQKEANVNKAIEDTDVRLKYNLLRIRQEQGQNDQALKMEQNAQIGALEDKINTERDAGRETIDLELELQAMKDEIRKSELDKEKELAAQKKAIREAEFNLSASFVNGLLQINSNAITKELYDLQQKQAYELQMAGDNADARAVIQNKYAKEEAALKTRQAKADKQAGLFNVAINTAQAVAKAIAISPETFGLPFSAFALAQGAIQAGVIASKPIPKYKKGTKSVPGVDTGQDSILALLQPGEAVIPVAQNKKFAPIISGIIDGTFDLKQMNYSEITKQAVVQQTESLGGKIDNLTRTIKGLPIANVNIDKNGIRTFMKQGHSETEFTNRYFRN